MYGDIIEIAENTLFVEGLEPKLIFKEPDIASSVLYKSGSTLYIMDTGASRFFRERILKAADMLRPYNKVILLNSHGHPDHTPNNSILREIAAEKKEHYISRPGIKALDYYGYFENNFRSVSEYYNLEDGPKFPISILTRPMKLLRLINAKLIDHSLTIFIVKKVLSKFMPLEPSKETAIPFENVEPSEMSVGDIELSGWNLNGDVYVIETRGHSPDSVSFYLPKVKVLFLADETTDYFNCWPDSDSGRVVSILNKSLAMYRGGYVETLIGGHQQQAFKGDAITGLLETLLNNDAVFKKELFSIVDRHASGVTVNRAYNELKKKKNIPAVRRYFGYEFPKMPGMLKTCITCMLLEEGLAAGGPKGRKVFKRNNSLNTV